MNKMEKGTNKLAYTFGKGFTEPPNWTEFKISGKPYISWGDKNLMPEYLISLKENSGTHNAILQKRSLYTYGNGLAEGQEIPQFKLGEKETLKAIIDDYWLYGMWAMNVVWSKDGRSIAHAEHIDMSKLRAGKKNPLGKIEDWFFSNDWKNYRKQENKPVPKKAYDPRNPIGSQIFVYRGYSSGCSFYSKPSYYGAANYMALDYEISNFHLNNAQNGFAPSMMITMHDMPDSQEERDYIYESLKKQYQGTSNAGEIFLMFARDKENGIEVTPINANDSDTRYKDLMGIVQDQILIGHSVVSPILYGIKTPGQLGGSNELATSFEITMSTEIDPVQKQIGETLQNVLKLDFQPEFVDSSPVSFAFSESVMEKILTQNELRDLISYEPLAESESTIEEDSIDNENNTI